MATPFPARESGPSRTRRWPGLAAVLLLWAGNAMASALWTPASAGAPAMGVWFDGADSATLTLNSSAQLLGWHDKSGNNRDATADASYAPGLTSLNGRSAIDFGPFVFATTNPHMYFPEVQVQTVFKVWGSQAGGMFLMTNRYNYSWHRNSIQGDADPTSPILDAPNNYSEPSLRTGDAITRVNGTVVDPTTTGLSGDWDIVDMRATTGTTYPSDTLALDRTYRSGGQGMAEVIVLSTRPSEADVQRIEGYLAWKWGLQAKLPSNHPYKNQAPREANLIDNGGFEAGTVANNSFIYQPTDQGPWVFPHDAGVMVRDSGVSGGSPPTPEGRIAGFVQDTAYLEQTITVSDPSIYTLSFLIAQRQYLYHQTLSIQVDGVEVTSVSTPGDTSWQRIMTPAFVLGAGNHVIRFQGTVSADATAFIDDVSLSKAPQGTLLVELHFEETGWSGAPGEVVDSSGNGHPGAAISSSTLPTSGSSAPALPGSPGTCSYAVMTGSGFDVPNLPVSTSPGDSTTVMFWMYWDGTNGVMPMGWDEHDLWLVNGNFGFNTDNSDVWGIASAPLANGWHHVAAIFVNGSVSAEQLYIDGVAQAMSQRQGGQNQAMAVVASTMRIGGFTHDNGWRFSGYLDEFKVYIGALDAGTISAAASARHACVSSNATASFNAYETATAAGATTGVIHTKVAGTPFAIDVIATDMPPTAVRTDFTGSVKVELLNAADNSGAFNASACRSTWAPVTSGASTSTTFNTADAGRKTVTLTEPEAWRDLRVRITTPATGSVVAQACSSDDFAVRPASFTGLNVSDASSASAGTTRPLANTGASGGVVHKAGQPFTVRATAVNGAGVATANYTNTPTPAVTACAGTACGAIWTRVAGENTSFVLASSQTVRYGVDTRWAYLTLGPGTIGCNNGVFGDSAPGTVKECDVGVAGVLSLIPGAAAGVINQTGSYNEVGAFSLQLVDSSFAGVDANDGSSAAEMTITSAVIDVGRFVPDHFDLTQLAAPVLKTFDSSCSARSFTYVGQPFGHATVPQARVLARNAAGATTAGYAGALWKLDATGLAQAYTPTPATPTLDSSATLMPTLTSNGDGTGLLVGAGTSKLRFDRSSATPLAPFNASIALSWSAQDASEAGVAGNGNITTPTPLVFASIAFDAGAQMRFGVLRLQPAYGSELVDLPVAIEAQYWDGQRMATNAADQCTALPASAVAMGNYQRSLAACKTALGTGTATLTNGRGRLLLAKPGNGNAGSVDLALQLGASATGQVCSTVNGSTAATAPAGLPWLQGRWGNAPAFDQNPSTRASFGQYRSPLIYLREIF